MSSRTKIFTVRASTVMPELLLKQDATPASWLPGLVQKVCYHLGTDDPLSVKTKGVAALEFSLERPMTEEEVRDERIAELEAKLGILGSKIPASGDGTVTLSYAELREILAR